MIQHTFQIVFVSTNKSIFPKCYTLTICVHNTILLNYVYVSSIKTNRTKKLANMGTDVRICVCHMLFMAPHAYFVDIQVYAYTIKPC